MGDENALGGLWIVSSMGAQFLKKMEIAAEILSIPHGCVVVCIPGLDKSWKSGAKVSSEWRQCQSIK